eukprot:TRINITY_DN15573_c0_g1_i2.p1 TRINITY_DN15573_c0_g1~~TRINITY_DN15573_c0_g1_i2.p1  ORF type:complete len:143 (-),score=22.31 TRINITY_DN15573_c0_g1_i2:175-564(-)
MHSLTETKTLQELQDTGMPSQGVMSQELNNLQFYQNQQHEGQLQPQQQRLDDQAGDNVHSQHDILFADFEDGGGLLLDGGTTNQVETVPVAGVGTPDDDMAEEWALFMDVMEPPPILDDMEDGGLLGQS